MRHKLTFRAFDSKVWHVTAQLPLPVVEMIVPGRTVRFLLPTKCFSCNFLWRTEERSVISPPLRLVSESALMSRIWFYLVYPGLHLIPSYL